MLLSGPQTLTIKKWSINFQKVILNRSIKSSLTKTPIVMEVQLQDKFIGFQTKPQLPNTLPKIW